MVILPLIMDLPKKKSDWVLVQEKLKEKFGDELQIDAILFLIGIQELGMGRKKFKKDDKINILHIAICTLLEPYGFYKFIGRDKDGWPHWELTEKIPALESKEQNKLMTEAIVDYFKKQELI